MFRILHKIFSKDVISLKIFFCSKKGLYSFLKADFPNILALILAASVVAAQGIRLIPGSAGKSVSTVAEPSLQKAVFALKEPGRNGVKLLLDGEEAAVFEGGIAQVWYKSGAVAEIYNPDYAGVNVTLDNPPVQKLCKKGISYFCKLP